MLPEFGAIGVKDCPCVVSLWHYFELVNEHNAELLECDSIRAKVNLSDIVADSIARSLVNVEVWKWNCSSGLRVPMEAHNLSMPGILK